MKGVVSNLQLRSTNGPIASSRLGSLRPTPKETPVEEIRRRYEEDGYVWIKGLLPKEDVWKMREAYFSYLPGLTNDQTSPREGIYSGGDWRVWMTPGKLRQKFGHDSENNYTERIVKAHSEPWYREFCKHPDLRAFIRKFTSWDDATMLERSILRPNLPNAETTQVHYDQIFLRGGPATFITAWVPIGDCAVNGGGLLYLEKSADIGEKLENQFSDAASQLSEEERISAYNVNMRDVGHLTKDAGAFAKTWDRKWLCAQYEAGDVVLHSPFTIHCSALNEDKDNRIRIATDVRFVEAGKPHDKRWMATWNPRDGL